MAIKDMKGTVTTTGMINEKPISKAPDMSGIKMPTKPKQVAQKPVPQNTPREESLLDKVQNLTNEDKAVLTTVLSPSVSKVLSKIAPDLNPLLTQFTKDEENVTLPVSVVKNFATKRYGGQNETEAVTSFIADLQSSVPGMDNTMEQQSQPVPPDTQMANSEESMMQPEIDEIDSGMMEA